MRPDDKGQFTKLLAATMDVYGRQITTGFVDVFFSALTPYPLDIVREAQTGPTQGLASAG